MLNPKQEKFVREYLKDLNATQAAIRAGYAPGSAMVTGSRLLSHAKVSQAIAEKQGKTLAKLDISVERILLERARLAFFDPAKLLDNTGRPLPFQDIDEDTRRAIAGIDVEDLYDGGGKDREKIGTVVKFKLADKNASLTALEKINGMYSSGDEPAGVLNIHVHF